MTVTRHPDGLGPVLGDPAAKPQMEMNGVKGSASIAAHGYDPTTKKLRIKFVSGGTYEYDDVPADKYAALTGAQSLGGFFHSRIKDKHQGRKV